MARGVDAVNRSTWMQGGGFAFEDARSTAARGGANVRVLVRRSATLPSMLAALALALGCARCTSRKSEHGAPDAGPAPAPTIPALLPAPKPWTFVRLRVDAEIALPERCRSRAPTARARVGELTRFVAEPRTLGALVVADATAGDPPRLAGVAALTLDPEGVTRDPVRLPWFEPAVLPRLARAGSRWIAALDQAEAAHAARVLLWRGGEVETVGEGDGFEAVDLACTSSPPARCALLTTRALKVAAPGATVWIGSPDEPAAQWKPTEIVPTSADGDARPLGVAALDETHAAAAVVEKGDVVLHAAGEPAPREIARLPAPHGALDALALPAPVVMAYPSKVDDEGCARDGQPGIRFVRAGAPPVDFPLPGPPIRGALRRLAHGAIAAWVTPLGCRGARTVVYALLFDESGAPVGSPIPVGDADGFAIAAQGDDVDLWLQDETKVTWVRAGCGPR